MQTDYSAILNRLIQELHDSRQKDWWDVCAVVLTALSLGLVAWSTVLSRRMQEASNKQASAALEAVRESVQQRQVAEKALEEARKQTLLSVRPLVIIETVLEQPPDDTPSTNSQGLINPFKYRNIGRGPAFNVMCEYVACGDSMTLMMGGADLIQEDRSATMMIALVRGNDAVAPLSDATALSELIIKEGNPSPVTFDIRYSDLYGTFYRSRMMFWAGMIGHRLNTELRYVPEDDPVLGRNGSGQESSQA